MTPGRLLLEPLVPAPLVIVVSALLVGTLVVSAARRRSGWLKPLHRGAIVVLAGFAALGPHVGSEPTTYQQLPETQVVVAVDATASMAVEDQAGASRWQVAVADVAELAGVHDGAFALVSWGDRARLVVPFTTDSAAFGRALRALSTERPVEGVGSRIDRPLTVLSRVVTQARAQHPEKETALLLLSDGENTAGRAQRRFSRLAPMVSRGLVVGYGTDAGGHIPLEPGTPTTFVPDPTTGRPAVSRRDGDNLERVATELGVPYLRRESVGDLVDAAEALKPELRTVAGPRSSQDVTWVVGLLLLVLSGVELRFAARSALELRSLRRAR